MKIKKLIHFYDANILQALEKLADDGGYTTLTAFVNENWKNLVEQKSIQVLNAHFSQDNAVGIAIYDSSDKKTKNTTHKTKQSNFNTTKRE